MNSRIHLIAIIVTLSFLGLIIKSFYLQILPSKKLTHWVDKNFNMRVKVHPKRPTIVDRWGKEIALSVETYSLFVDPTLIQKNHKQYAQLIASVLNQKSMTILKKIKQKNTRFVWIERFLNDKKKRQIEDLNLPPAFGFIKEYTRLYPNYDLLKPVIGFVGTDGQGLSGIEFWIDHELNLRSQFKTVPKDARGRWVFLSDEYLQEFLSDRQIQLTIDLDIQYYFEHQLKKAIEEQNALAGFAIAMDVEHQEIRAMAYLEKKTFPDKKFLKNPLISNVYEFGSVLKPIIMAIALEEKVIDEKFTTFLENGKFKINDKVIKDVNYDPNLSHMNLKQIIYKSSNIGTAKIGLMLGAEKLKNGLLKFRLNEKSCLGLPGESKGIINELPWSKHLLGNISIGQGIAITPMQLMMAWSALTNKGKIKKPILIKKIYNQATDDSIIYESTVLQEVLQESTVEYLRSMLVEVVSDWGTGKKAKILGYQVAGKTGTAQKAHEKERGYKKGAYLNSFIGYFPANNPKFLILVALDEPQKDQYASSSVAPLFANLGDYLARKEALIPNDPKEIEQQVLPLIKNDLSKHDLNLKILLSNSIDQPPKNLPEIIEQLRAYQVPLRIRGQGSKVIDIKPHWGTNNTIDSLEVFIE